jgi:hypothetical protein
LPGALLCAAGGPHGGLDGLPVDELPLTVTVVTVPLPVAVPLEAVPLEAVPLAHAGMLPTARPAASVAISRVRIASPRLARESPAEKAQLAS